MMAIGLVGKPVDSCFEDAEKTGKLSLSNRNLRELPNSCDKYDMEDVFVIGKSLSCLNVSLFLRVFE